MSPLTVRDPSLPVLSIPSLPSLPLSVLSLFCSHCGFVGLEKEIFSIIAGSLGLEEEICDRRFRRASISSLRDAEKKRERERCSSLVLLAVFRADELSGHSDRALKIPISSFQPR